MNKKTIPNYQLLRVLELVIVVGIKGHTLCFYLVFDGCFIFGFFFFESARKMCRQ
jgi:hypothetical protein